MALYPIGSIPLGSISGGGAGVPGKDGKDASGGGSGLELVSCNFTFRDYPTLDLTDRDIYLLDWASRGTLAGGTAPFYDPAAKAIKVLNNQYDLHIRIQFLGAWANTTAPRCLRLWLKSTSKGSPVTIGYMTIPTYDTQDNPVFEISYPTASYSPGDVIIPGINVRGSGNVYHLNMVEVNISQLNPKTGA